MEQRTLNKRFESIAKGLIKKEKHLAYIKNSRVRIAYLESDSEKKSKGRLVFGECEKIPDKYKWSIPYDFTITVYTLNIEHFNDEQLKILLLHELMHIGIEVDGNEESYHVIPHDIEDFKAILDRFGMDWSA
ncbi:MAG: hypothetical protein IJ113_09530 [Eggerthellaceae bacterium]|nr:hypothetical protein [Eggerthellaceae bacterium]